MSPPRNPKWNDEELILLLELYFKHPAGSLMSSHPDVIALSHELNELPIQTVRPDRLRFRNANGVSMKLKNLTRFDDTYTGSGLAAGGVAEERLWNEYVNDRERLSRDAAAIRAKYRHTQKLR